MNQPIPAQLAPYPVEVVAGTTYFWCACGHSKTQPFCDGSHKGTGLAPMKYEAGRDGTLYFCGCKATAKQPFCDGSHNRL